MILTYYNYQHMLEYMPINVIICDSKEFKIVYANQKSRKTLDSISHLLPSGVNGNNLIGRSIDIFHQRPEHQHTILRNPNNLPYKGTIRLGKEYLELEIIAVPSLFKWNKAYMLSWSVITQTEILKKIVDKMPISVMICDPETFTISYANKNAIDTLRKAERALPVRADQILGSSIEALYDHLKLQRHLLTDPKNLPHQGKIQLGDQALDQNVVPIIDDRGHYIGPMVLWNVSTDSAKLSQVNNIVDDLAKAASALSQLSNNMHSINNLARQQSDDVLNASNQTSNNIKSMSGATDVLTESVKDIARQTNASKEAVNQAVSKVEAADQLARNLRNATESIGQVVGVIEKISEQINLLALNATIESVRAGDAGKGFAVVANEVKTLAGQATNATKEISHEIENVQQIFNQVTAVLENIRTAINSVRDSSVTVATAVEAQTTVTEEISSNMRTASNAVNTISNSISEIAKITKQTQTSNDELQQAAEKLSKQAEELRYGIKDLLK